MGNVVSDQGSPGPFQIEIYFQDPPSLTELNGYPSVTTATAGASEWGHAGFVLCGVLSISPLAAAVFLHWPGARWLWLAHTRPA